MLVFYNIIPKSGAYILLVSQCTKVKVPPISGRVVVESVHGYLPVNEYPLLVFTRWLFVAYLVLTALWRNLTPVQHGASACLVVTLLYSLASHYLLFVWNLSASRSAFLLFCRGCLSVAATASFWLLALLGSQGLYITKPSLEAGTRKRVAAVFAAYVLFGIAGKIQLIVFPLRDIMEILELVSHRNGFGLALVLLQFIRTFIPIFWSSAVLLLGVQFSLCACIWWWTLTALSSLLRTLKEGKQNEKLRVFRALFWILVAYSVAFLAISVLHTTSSLRKTSVYDFVQYAWVFEALYGGI
uniref:Intimal thickness related receptor IRP domain-containing protein n=1 Tax=Chromera velia CCMP2878 TaxID=1169474 RepID=A0A0G4HJN4_9ALVE|mmetsp:Transcript_17473/g.35486  ORF Transcript_17473/g.35486 Transcript_17473/m.35486 type:complete len:299 (-) Transcript_17473:96-992(-)|eukprot:Cvel_7099.t1-p1 / transcript=Cvel_7099.t1 / gene=Cvel_7099 / organism=Chromera_velia_CCMP2878 / gene_product=hypothetical protein / transcript_product=hypothetical protein / location=Cvel_scaffold364:1315-5887(+) / protein_length=298 / sequence_SO=supercontig / SO=protein_coding / is_pseudo=false